MGPDVREKSEQDLENYRLTLLCFHFKPMTTREVKSTFSDNNDMKIKFLPCWTCKFGKNISRNKLKYDLMKINCVFGIKVVSRPKTRTKLRTPQASPSNLSVCQKTVNQEAKCARFWLAELSHFIILWVESWEKIWTKSATC